MKDKRHHSALRRQSERGLGKGAFLEIQLLSKDQGMEPEGPPEISAGSERKGRRRPRLSEALEPRAATLLPSKGTSALLLPQMVHEESAKPPAVDFCPLREHTLRLRLPVSHSTYC